MPKQRDPENDCHVLFHLSVSGPLMGSSLIYSANQNLLILFLPPEEIQREAVITSADLKNSDVSNADDSFVDK